MARLFLPESHLPESFTICSALRVDAWTSKSITMIDLLDICGSTELQTWESISIYVAPGCTEYTVTVSEGKVSFVRQVEAVSFTLQGTRACFSLDSVSSKVTLVVDGHLLAEEEYKREEDYNVQPARGYQVAPRIWSGRWKRIRSKNSRSQYV